MITPYDLLMEACSSETEHFYDAPEKVSQLPLEDCYQSKWHFSIRVLTFTMPVHKRTIWIEVTKTIQMCMTFDALSSYQPYIFLF